MRVVRIHGKHFNSRQVSDLTLRLRDESPFEGCVCVCVCGGGGAYAWDKSTSARLRAKIAGGLMREGGGVFAGHYGTWSHEKALIPALISCRGSKLAQMSTTLDQASWMTNRRTCQV